MTYNVILEGNDMGFAIAPRKYGWAIPITSNTCGTAGGSGCKKEYVGAGLPTPGAAGTVISHNVIAHSLSDGSNGQGIHLNPLYNSGFGFSFAAVTGVTVSRNVICNWRTHNNKPIWDEGSGNTISDNVTNTASDCTTGIQPALRDPTRTAATYYVTVLGGPAGSTTDDFLDFCWTKWTKAKWEPRCLAAAVNNWIRPGYGVSNP
jgi:hypothetical protein